jgi:hypothetical protein
MATTVYHFELTENSGSGIINIAANDVDGFANDWNEISPQSGLLITEAGSIKETTNGLECRGPGAGIGVNVLILKGASWSTSTGQSGDAELFLYENTSPYYAWKLLSVK